MDTLKKKVPKSHQRNPLCQIICFSFRSLSNIKRKREAQKFSVRFMGSIDINTVSDFEGRTGE